LDGKAHKLIKERSSVSIRTKVVMAKDKSSCLNSLSLNLVQGSLNVLQLLGSEPWVALDLLGVLFLGEDFHQVVQDDLRFSQ